MPTLLNPVSCIVCRQRKVKCDRVSPSCTNCSKGDSPCIYLAPLRTSRRKQVNEHYLDEASREAVLLQRLKKLEAMVAVLESKVETAAAISEPHSTLNYSVAAADPSGISQPLGTLVVKDGQRRYIRSSVWDILSEEVCDFPPPPTKTYHN
jgi:hypothetical protein